MKKVLFLILVFFLFLAVWYAPLIHYGIQQGIGQLSVVLQARPVIDVLRDPNFPDTIKQKLRVIAEVKDFSTHYLGLKDTDSYTTVFDQKGENIMWVVTACRPFALVSKTWHFPIVGTVPYKGFFSKQEAYRELEELNEEGWDTDIRSPLAWSTLGWFKDPILSNMLRKNEADLANVIIHEMVHGTIFLKDSVLLNENLASFIADYATYDFLAHKYGKQSVHYTLYHQQTEEYQRYQDHILRGVRSLDSLYHTFPVELSTISKKKLKNELIANIISTMDTLSFQVFKPPIDRFKKGLPNNTYFLSYLRYDGKRSYFYDELHHKYKDSLPDMLRYYALHFPYL